MRLNYLPNHSQKYTDSSDEYARFILGAQLKDEALWASFTEVFRTREDALDRGWRGEYFGKMMRGACLTYRYLGDETLYALLERVVRELVATADDEGRIATYPKERELIGWDVWCRKYVLVGCLHFYEICRDEKLKAEILAAMNRHLCALEEVVGEGKRPITETSEWYGGMNASSILEPVVEMYKLTRDPRHLAFARHILSQGGCKGGNVIEEVERGEKLPHELPTTKAYETMSFFEGALAYYEATGEERYLSVVEKFCDLVDANEITVIGCAGCRNEHFDHAAETQTRKYKRNYIMQETCVTVTWMRLQERLLRVTGSEKYAARVERSALNALYGAVNLYGEKQYGKEEKRRLAGLPFDSYSPLVAARRGIGIGGFKRLASGGFYGCCACIGAAGTALYPLSSALSSEEGLTLSFYHAGEVEYRAKDKPVRLEIEGSLAEGEIKLITHLEEESAFSISLRIPGWSACPELDVNGESQPIAEGYVTLSRTWREGDEITLSLRPLLTLEERADRFALRYGPFVLARDEGKECPFAPHRIDLRQGLSYRKLPPEKGEAVRIRVEAGKRTFLVTDYASCGKHWTRRRSRITVWQRKK